MTVKLMGIDVDNYSFEDSVIKGVELIESNKVTHVVTINPEMCIESQKNENFKKIIREADLVIPDGIGIKIALNLRGKNVSRVPGVDFAKKLLELSAQKGYSVAIVGAKEEVVTKAVKNLRDEINGLNIVYYHNGYFDDDNIIYEDLKQIKPRLVLIATGSPKQEFFIYNAKNILFPCLMIGIGGSLDVWSGSVKRAPKIYQKIGLEWLYRTVTQPERFKRIFPALPLFLLKSILYKEG